MLLQFKARGWNGVRFVAGDDPPGLKAASWEVLPGLWWRRRYVHFLRKALDWLPRKAGDDRLLEKWAAKHPKLCARAETNIEETRTFYRLPLTHHQHIKSTNLLARFHLEIKRRTLAARIFQDEAIWLRLVRAVAAEQPGGLGWFFREQAAPGTRGLEACAT